MNHVNNIEKKTEIIIKNKINYSLNSEKKKYLKNLLENSTLGLRAVKSYACYYPKYFISYFSEQRPY